jgi:hypothetical protein
MRAQGNFELLDKWWRQRCRSKDQFAGRKKTLNIADRELRYINPRTPYLKAAYTKQKKDIGKTSNRPSPHMCLSHPGTRDLLYENPGSCLQLGGAWGKQEES